jgi:hypothetical protein
MKSRQDAKSLVRDAFPGHDALIDSVFRDHATFRELCEDYRKCAVALERWRRLNGEGPLSRTREYTELLAELAEEIELWLDAMENGSVPPRRSGGR